MPRIDAVVDCAVRDSFRVQQVAGMFDLPWQERAKRAFSVELPELDEPWEIGLITGPSGSGKSTIAREAYGAAMAGELRWPTDRAVIDCFTDVSVRQATELLTSVGFGSPPAWVRPYQTLSGGEKFRCDLARALAVGTDDKKKPIAGRPLVVFDEFTSVVDRQVAQFGCAALARSIRQGRVGCRFVGVTCHRDVAEWLEPDWVLDMASNGLDRRRLRRPRINLRVVRCRQDLWRMFAPHHYLSGNLSRGAHCYVALWDGEPVAFCAILALIGKRGCWRISRLVTLPDYQGLGIGMRLAAGLGGHYAEQGLRLSITTSHPAVIAHCQRSTRWRARRVMRIGSRHTGIRGYRGSAGRAVVSFEFQQEAAACDKACGKGCRRTEARQTAQLG